MKRIEKVLKEIVKVFKIILDDSIEGFIIVNYEGIIEFINKSYCDFLKIEQTKAVGRNVAEIIPTTRVLAVLKSGKEEINWKHQYDDGREVIVNRIPIIVKGQIIGVLGQVIFRDMNELRDLAIKCEILESKIKYYEKELGLLSVPRYTMADILGEDERIIQVKKLAVRASQSQSAVLIEGESGTGKELFAHAIHHASKRRDSPFIRVNCAAIPFELIEAELFGYKKGAFTGATGWGNPGKFELADKGTIFLDEIGEMPLSMQTKLLRVLDEKEITPLGSRSSKKVDFRLIAASNKSLENMVRENKFRLDLFYRLNVMHIELPPLREIKGSIDAICHHFVEKKCKEMGHNTVKISSEVIKLFREYDWPGNVRELTNLIENAINICDGKLIILSDLPKSFLRNFDKSPKMGLNKKLAGLIQECEEQAIQEALRVTGNNKRQAAKILGIHRSWLYQKINRFKMKDRMA